MEHDEWVLAKPGPSLEENKTLCVAINRDNPVIGPSETFLRAHAESLHGRTVVLLGNPGHRRVGIASVTPIRGQGLLSRAVLYGLRRAGVQSLTFHDDRTTARYLRSASASVVLAEYGPTAIGIVGACLRAGVPLVAHFHGWDAYSLPRDPKVASAYRRVFQHSAAIVAVSRHMAEHLVTLGAPASKIHWNPCGARLVPEDLAADPDSSPRRFVTVGRLVDKKAPVLHLLAFAKAREAVPDITLDVIGDGPLMGVCRQVAHALDIADAVTFHGAQDNQFVLELLRSARGFLHHSVTASNGDREGTPVAVLEAMATGLPVVATRHGGIVDVVVDGVTGLLVDEFDLNGTAAALVRLSSDPGAAGTMGRAARASVKADWSMENSLSRLRTVLAGAA